MDKTQKEKIREKWWANAMQKNGNNYDPAIAEKINEIIDLLSTITQDNK